MRFPFPVLFLGVFLTVACSRGPAPKSSPIRAWDEDYENGRTFFYRTLKDWAAYMDGLAEPDRRGLVKAEKAIPGLYEHLMNFYAYAARALDPEEPLGPGRFSVLSIRMAEEFLCSIPAAGQAGGPSPLAATIAGTGYGARRAIPKFRRFLRPMASQVKGHWALQELKIPEAQVLARGSGVKIALIDTGLDPTIQEIKVELGESKDLLSGEKPCWGKTRFPFDWMGHGTGIATLVSRVAPEAELMIVKVIDEPMTRASSASWNTTLMEAGIAWAVEHGADVINLSAAVRVDAERLREIVRRCWERNVVLVTSMGNLNGSSSDERPFYPAAYPWTIAVGGAERKGGPLRVWKGSAPGDYLDVVAPAASITVEQPSYLDKRAFPVAACGNSLATAFVSGTAALVLSAMDRIERDTLKERPGALSDKVRAILCETASNARLGLKEGFNITSGFGLIDPLKAVNAARKGIGR
jgi:subtilisin family serine protease